MNSQRCDHADWVTKEHPEKIERMADRMVDAATEIKSGGIAAPPVFPRVPGRQMLPPHHTGMQGRPDRAAAEKLTDPCQRRVEAELEAHEYLELRRRSPRGEHIESVEIVRHRFFEQQVAASLEAGERRGDMQIRRVGDHRERRLFMAQRVQHVRVRGDGTGGLEGQGALSSVNNRPFLHPEGVEVRKVPAPDRAVSDQEPLHRWAAPESCVDPPDASALSSEAKSRPSCRASKRRRPATSCNRSANSARPST